MRASKNTCGPRTTDYRLDILRQEEIDRRIEESEHPTGGHRVGSTTPTVPLRPPHIGLTSAEEHAVWLEDINHWQGEYPAILADLECVRAFIVENRDALREHAEMLAKMIAEHDAMTEEYEALKAAHVRARLAHERMEKHHHQVMPKLWIVTRAIREALQSVPATPRPAASLG